MTRTDLEVGYSPKGERGDYTAQAAAQSVQNVIRVLEGRWKLVILFQLFGGNVRRFSELERAIPGISQKMLIQQLRQLEADGVVVRTTYAVVPPRVEYHLTEWGQSLCPVLDNLLTWAESAPDDVRARLIDSDATAPAAAAPAPSPTASATPSETGQPTSDTNADGRPAL